MWHVKQVSILLMLFLAPILIAQVQPETFILVKENSSIKFSIGIKMLGISSEVPGKFNQFTVTAVKVSGSGKSEVSVQISVNSIDTGNGARDKHLQKSDFFSEKLFKNISFKSTNIKSNGANNFLLDGVLTVKGQDHSISFPINAQLKDTAKQIWRVKGETKLNRQSLGITYKAPLFLPTVADDVTVSLDIELAPKTIK